MDTVEEPPSDRESVSSPTPVPAWSFRDLVRADLAVTVGPAARPGTWPYRVRVLAKIATGPNVRVVLWHRIAHELAKRRRWRWLAFMIRTHGIRLAGAEIHPDATIGPGLYVVHGIGVGVGRYAVIGRKCRLHLGSVIAPVAIHNDPRSSLVTTIGDDVSVGTNAVVLAGMTVGDGAVIGANAVVMRDVEPYAIVACSPGRVVGERPRDLNVFYGE